MAKASESNSNNNKPLSKSQLLANLAEATQLQKKDVAALLDALTEEIRKAVSKKGPGQFALPGLLKIIVRAKPASPKKQVRNPSTGEMVWSGPKPASRVVRVRPMKGLKEMV
jgi:nucleoid DNA-binding protein